MGSERLTAGLSYERLDRHSLVSVGGAAILRLRHGDARAHVDLVLLNGSRTIDVSWQPAAPVDLLRDQARRDGHDPNGWTGALGSAVAEDARRWGLWSGPGSGSGDGDLVRLLGGMSHPMLAAVYGAGGDPVGEVPRWASPAFGEATVAACAVRLFGAGPSTRAVVKALAGLLTRPPLPWWTLAVTVAAAAVVEPDHLVRALAFPVDESVVPVLPYRQDVRVARAGLKLVGATRARRLLLDATAEEGGARRLVAVLQLLGDVERDVEWPPPGRLDELERVCLGVAALDPPRPVPAPPAAPVRRAPVTEVRDAPRPVMAPAAPAWTVARGAPGVGGPRPHPDAHLRPTAVGRSLCGVALTGDVELVRPRTPGELRIWGRILGNCLADFGPAVAAGATVVLGVRKRGALVAALEIRDRRIVQLLGPGNRPPPPQLSEVVVRHVQTRLSHTHRSP